MKNKLLPLIILVTAPVFAGDTYIHSSEASKHAGKTVRVCGYAADVSKEDDSAGKPYVIDIGSPYPGQDLSVIIWEKDSGGFGDIYGYKGSDICISGKITPLKKKAVMVVTNPAQITPHIRPKALTAEEADFQAKAKIINFVYKPRTVKMLKKILADTGYVTGDKSERWDIGTYRVLMEYQKAKKLKTTGVFDKPTLSSLQKESAESQRLDEKTKRFYFDELEKLFEFW